MLRDHTRSGWHWDYHALSACWEYHTLSAARWEYYSLRAACWEYDTLSTTQPTNTQARHVVEIANKYIEKTIIFSSFNDIDLLRSMLANCCMRWCQGEGTMAAIGQWRPSWLGCIFLPSFRPANCYPMSPNSKTTQKPTLSHLMSLSIKVGWGHFKYPSCAHALL